MTATRDRYAVLGNPVAHSRSPVHPCRLRAPDRAGHRVRPRAVPAGRLRGRGARLRRRRRSGRARGCNVTVPFKFEALRLAARCSDARRAGRRGQHAALRRRRLAGRQHRRRRPGARHRAATPACRWPAGACCWSAPAAPAPACWARCWRRGRPRWWWPTARPTRRRRWSTRHCRLARARTACGCTRRRRWTTPAHGFDVVLNASASSLQGRPSPVPAGGAGRRRAGGGPDVRRRRRALPGLGARRRRRARATAWACWSSRRPRPSSSGAACARSPRRCCRRCATAWRRGMMKPPALDRSCGGCWRCCCCARVALQLVFALRIGADGAWSTRSPPASSAARPGGCWSRSSACAGARTG